MDYHEKNFKILQNKLMIEMINHYIDNKPIKQVGGKRETEPNPLGKTLNIADDAKSALIKSIPTPSVDELLKPIINKMMLLLKPLETRLVSIVDDYAKTSLTKTEQAYNKLIKKFFKLIWGVITGAIGAIPVVGNAASVIIKGVKSVDRIFMIIKIGIVYFFTMVDLADDKLLTLAKELNEKYEAFLELKQQMDNISGVINKQKDDMLDVNAKIQNMFEAGINKTITQVGGRPTPSKPIKSTKPTKPATTKPATTKPIKPAPAPAEPTPVKPAPVKPAPVKPAPAEPTPAPAPAAPAPAEPTPAPAPAAPPPAEPTPSNEADEQEDIDIFNLIPVKKIFKQLLTTITEEIGEDIALDTLHFSESIISETIERFLSLFSEFLVTTFTDMMKNIEPSKIREALLKIEEKEKNFSELKYNLEKVGVPSLFVLPLTARLAILYASRLIYETGDYVYGSVEETIDFVESSMKEIINMVVRIIMQGICKTSGDCRIIYS